MLIGQLSKRTGFSKDTIRYYEKIALIALPGKKRFDRQYKDYPEELVYVLRAIRKYKELGFTLEEIRELLVLQSIQVLDISKLIAVVERKLNGIDARIDELHAMRLQLNRERQVLLGKKSSHIIKLPEMKRAA